MTYRNAQAQRQRIELLMRALAIDTHVDMARRVGMEYHAWMKQMTRGLTAGNAMAIAAAFPGIDPSWLLDGRETGLSVQMLNLLRRADHPRNPAQPRGRSQG